MEHTGDGELVEKSSDCCGCLLLGKWGRVVYSGPGSCGLCRHLLQLIHKDIFKHDN